MVKHAKPIRGIMRNPMTRTDHPNPKLDPFSILDKAIGMTMPPTEDPETTTPNAEARSAVTRPRMLGTVEIPGLYPSEYLARA